MALDNIPTLGPGGFNGNLDKVLVYKNGGSEVACSLLTLTNSALNLSGVYLDPVNQRMGIGAPNPTTALELGGVGASIKLPNDGSLFLNTVRFATNNSSIYVGDINGTGTPIYLIPQGGGTNGSIRLGGGQLALFKGSGSTSATSSLLVQNSSGNNTFRVLDNGFSFMSTGVSFQELKFYPQFSSISGGYGGSITFSNTSNDTTISDNRITLTAPAYSDSLAVGVSGIYAVVTSNAFSINSTTQGFLPPRLTTTQKNAIATPAAGLEVYDTDLNRPCFFNGTSWITL